jgi:hypothetical protein
MPVEVLGMEEIEKVVEEKLRKLLAETEIWKIAEFETLIVKLLRDC